MSIKKKVVSVTHEFFGGVSTIAWFDTIPEAENFIVDREKTDPAGVRDGKYGIDAPEEMTNGRS